MSVKSGKLLSGEELRLAHEATDQSLPTIGQKDFKPTGSWLEKKQIQTALDEKKQLLEHERVEKLGFLAQAVWYDKRKLAEVTFRAGKFALTMGFEKDGKIFLYPEEALYLLETNCLELMYHGVAMSIQQGYSLLLSPTDCSLNQYRTYSHLSKQGYRLLRYSKTAQPTAYELQMRLDQHVPHKRVFPDVNLEEESQTTEVNLEEELQTTETTEVDLVEDERDEETTEVDLVEDEHDEETTETTGKDEQSPVCDAAAMSSNKKEGTGSRKEVPLDKRKDVLCVNDEPDGKDSINGQMKDFAQSVADMGKSLVKTEKCEGTQGLGLDSLRQKLLDMLKSHFQGQISQEAMDAVSLSASKAILVHVEDVDSDKKQTNEGTSGESGSSQGVECEDNDDSSSAMVPDHSSDVDGENLEELDNTKGKSPEERTQVDIEDVAKRSDGAESDGISKRADEAESKEVSRSGQAESEEVPKKSSETESVEVSKESSEAESVEVSKESDKAESEEVSKKSGQVSVEVSKKSGEAESVEVSRKSGEAESEESSKESDKAESEEVSKKSGEAESEEVSENRSGLGREEPEKTRQAESAELLKESVCEKLPEESGNEDSEGLAEKIGDLEKDDVSKKIVDSDSKTKSDTERDDASEKKDSVTSERSDSAGGVTKKTDLETIRVEKTVISTAVGVLQPEPKISAKSSGNKSGELSSDERTFVGDKDKTDNSRQAKSDSPSKNGGAETMNGNKENAEGSDEKNSSTDDTSWADDAAELHEIPVESHGSQVSTQETEESSECDSDVSDSEVLEYPVFDGIESSHADDDVMEIDDPNSWKNVKVEAPDKGNNKRPFPDSNGWRSFKESQAESPCKKAKHSSDDELDIIAVRTASDIEIIDISDEVTSAKTKTEAREEIEVVDLDESESDSDSDSSEEKPVLKQEKVAQRPKVVSAFERARDTKRKHIMDAFPNMIDRPVLTVPVPARHLLPPNVTPVQPTYTIQRRALYFDRPYRPRPHYQPRRYFSPNSRYNNHCNDRPQPRQPNHYPRFRPPVNPPVWQGMLPQLIQNAQAMQAFQVITSIVLPMFGINNVGPTFRGQQPWNQNTNIGSPMWQPRPWQNNQQPWRNQQRPPWNSKNSNRPWARYPDREDEPVPERPKRPALLPTPGQVSPIPGQASPTPRQVSPTPRQVSPAPGPGSSWINDRMMQPIRSESRRPKRPFLFENSYTERTAKSAKELLTDIEDELCWKKIRKMNEGSDSDSEDEVTITPIRAPEKLPQLEPLLKLDQCTNSASIMESLQVVQKADSKALKVSGQKRILKISYDMFLPNVPLKKSLISRPNFRLCIIGVEDQFPSPGERAVLLSEIHDNVPLLFAIVHPDDISFFNYSSIDLPTQTFSN